MLTARRECEWVTSEERLLTVPVLKRILTSWFFSPGRSSGSPDLSSLLEGRLSWPATQTTPLTQSSFLPTVHTFQTVQFMKSSTVPKGSPKRSLKRLCVGLWRHNKWTLETRERWPTWMEWEFQLMGHRRRDEPSSECVWLIQNAPIKWNWDYSCACCTHRHYLA